MWTIAPELERVAHAKPRRAPIAVDVSIDTVATDAAAAAAVAVPQPLALPAPQPKVLCWVLTYPKAHELKATSKLLFSCNRCAKLAIVFVGHVRTQYTLCRGLVRLGSCC